MNNNQPTFWGITLKTIITHTITYFLMGFLAFFLFDYSTQYAETSLNLLMRQTTDQFRVAGGAYADRRRHVCWCAYVERLHHDLKRRVVVYAGS